LLCDFVATLSNLEAEDEEEECGNFAEAGVVAAAEEGGKSMVEDGAIVPMAEEDLSMLVVDKGESAVWEGSMVMTSRVPFRMFVLLPVAAETLRKALM